MLRDKLCNGFFKNVNICILTYRDMDSDESYHIESEFYYPDETTNDYEKEIIGATSNEQNQQYVDVFTMPNAQNYILG